MRLALFMEALGAFLMALIFSSLTASKVGVLAPLAVGFFVYPAVSFLARPISGAVLSPSVAMMLVLSGKMKRHVMVTLWGVQTAGAVLGALIGHAAFGTVDPNTASIATPRQIAESAQRGSSVLFFGHGTHNVHGVAYYILREILAMTVINVAVWFGHRNALVNNHLSLGHFGIGAAVAAAYFGAKGDPGHGIGNAAVTTGLTVAGCLYSGHSAPAVSCSVKVVWSWYAVVVSAVVASLLQYTILRPEPKEAYRGADGRGRYAGNESDDPTLGEAEEAPHLATSGKLTSRAIVHLETIREKATASIRAAAHATTAGIGAVAGKSSSAGGRTGRVSPVLVEDDTDFHLPSELSVEVTLQASPKPAEREE